jgi:tRNA(adenine34) deaminase
MQGCNEEAALQQRHEDERLMTLALAEAQLAAAAGEVPVGAVLACDGIVVARAYNLRETTADPTAHAEILALQRAARQLGDWRLNALTAYVTLEPCPMCASAFVLARIGRVVFGAVDPKAGACGSLFELHADSRLNHRYPVSGGVLASACGALLREFFRARRGRTDRTA